MDSSTFKLTLDIVRDSVKQEKNETNDIKQNISCRKPLPYSFGNRESFYYAQGEVTRKTAHVTEPSPFAILKLRDCSQAKSKHSNRELWQGQCAESSAITDRGKRVPISLRIVANALKKREIRQFNLNIFLW